MLLKLEGERLASHLWEKQRLRDKDMKTTLFIIVTTLSFALQASALDTKSITAKPTADNPQYDNKKAWPDLVGDEYFLKQKWPKARLLIWAHPGKKADLLDPANWDASPVYRISRRRSQVRQVGLGLHNCPS